MMKLTSSFQIHSGFGIHSVNTAYQLKCIAKMQIQADKVHNEHKAAAVERDAAVAVRVSMKKSQEKINNCHGKGVYFE